MTIITQRVWSEFYRPTRVQDCILPKDLKSSFQGFVDSGFMPHLLLVGRPGLGKTTVARAACLELNYDVYEINASLKNGIDTLRTEILAHAATVSFTGERKAVILDEMDYLNPQSTQPALRGFTQEYEQNCTFIGTCNFPSRIIEPLHSRFIEMSFKIPTQERAELAQQFFARAVEILEAESVEFERGALAAIIKKHFPDFRKCLNYLQKYAQDNSKIDTGIMFMSDANYEELFKALKSRSFPAVRKWVGENVDIDDADLYHTLYTTLSPILTQDTVPALVLHLADYQHRAAFVADREINNAALLASIMTDCKFQ